MTRKLFSLTLEASGDFDGSGHRDSRNEHHKLKKKKVVLASQQVSCWFLV